MMNNLESVPPNGTVEVATFKDKATGKFFLAIVHVDRDGFTEIVGDGYANVDEAKSAAWQAAQQLKAATVSTKRGVSR